MKKKMKKLICILFSMLVCAGISMPALAAGASIDYQKAVVANYLGTCSTDAVLSDAEKLALAFMRYSQEEDDLQVRCTTPLYDFDGNTTAYCVDFKLDNQPKGYAIVSMLKTGNPIAEFSFWGESGVLSLLKKLSIDSHTNFVGNGDNVDRLIYLGDLFIYEVQSANEAKAYPGGETIEIDSLNNAYYTSVVPMILNARGDNFNFETIIYEMSEIGITQSQLTLSHELVWGNVGDLWLMNQFAGSEDCAPTTATNMMWFWGDVVGYDWCIDYYTTPSSDFGKATEICNKMKQFMLWEDGVGVWYSFVVAGYRTYLEIPGENHSYSINRMTTPTYSGICDAVDDGYLVHTCMRRAGFLASGHDVLTCGYGENSAGDKYLLIADAWEDRGRMVDYYQIPNLIEAVGVKIGM